MTDDQLLEFSEKMLNESIEDCETVESTTCAAAMSIAASNLAIAKIQSRTDAAATLEELKKIKFQNRELKHQYHMVQILEKSDINIVHFDCNDINNCIIAGDLLRLKKHNMLPDDGWYLAHVESSKIFRYEQTGMEKIA